MPAITGAAIILFSRGLYWVMNAKAMTLKSFILDSFFLDS